MAMPSPQPGSRRPPGAITEAFALTARSDRLFVPLVVGAELVVLAFTALMVALWAPVFVVVGILLAVVAPLIVLNVRLKKVIAARGDGRSRPDGSGRSRPDGSGRSRPDGSGV